MAVYNSIRIYSNFETRGFGTTTDYRRMQGNVEKTGIAKTITNNCDLGTFSFDTTKIIKKYGKYLDIENIRDNVASQKWILKGNDVIISPGAITYEDYAPKKILNGKIKYFFTGDIYDTIAGNIINSIDDREGLFTNFTFKEMLIDIFDGLPNTIKDGYVYTYNSIKATGASNSDVGGMYGLVIEVEDELYFNYSNNGPDETNSYSLDSPHWQSIKLNPSVNFGGDGWIIDTSYQFYPLSAITAS